MAKRRQPGEKPDTAPQVASVSKLSSEAPAARDEGPRLLPLGPRPDEHPTVSKYIELADKMLGNKTKK